MGRRRQHSASRPRSSRVAGALAIAVAATAAISLVPATAAAAPGARGCDRPAGNPEEAAVLQYCPKKTPQKRERENRAVAPVGGAGGDGPAAPGPRDPAPEADTSTLPLLDYPASDGMSAIVWILLAIVALIAAREIYRRYLAERLGAGRSSQMRGRSVGSDPFDAGGAGDG